MLCVHDSQFESSGDMQKSQWGGFVSAMVEGSQQTGTVEAVFFFESKTSSVSWVLGRQTS